ncbi:hypothetical protein HK102_008630 [Quaeritorhiza haematococci]|nr:hypothetical protein HK102_008630 [Quaeritorhiza haematococci]
MDFARYHQDWMLTQNLCSARLVWPTSLSWRPMYQYSHITSKCKSLRRRGFMVMDLEREKDGGMEEALDEARLENKRLEQLVTDLDLKGRLGLLDCKLNDNHRDDLYVLGSCKVRWNDSRKKWIN